MDADLQVMVDARQMENSITQPLPVLIFRRINMKKVEGGICTWEDSQHCMPFDEVVCQKCPKFKTEPSPEPSMPLIKLPLRCSRGKACEYLCLDHCSICQFIKVDTTAQVQQVRKDFAEECIKILSEETSKIRVRIRAMAEKE